MAEKEFKVSEYITLKMEQDQTLIYVNGERFDQCKYLAFQIDTDGKFPYQRVRRNLFQNSPVGKKEKPVRLFFGKTCDGCPRQGCQHIFRNASV